MDTVAKSVLIDLPLSVDKVGSHVDQVENAVYGLVPVLEQILFVFDWPEIDDTVDAVDSA
jgi:hypothetical protein